MPSFPIRSRLILLFTLQVVIIFLAGGFYLDWRLRHTLEEELADKLEILAEAIALQFEPELLLNLVPGDEESRTYKNLESELQSVRRRTGVRRIFFFSRNGYSLMDTNAGSRIGMEYVSLQFAEKEVAKMFGGKSVSSPLFTGNDGRLYKTGFAPVFADKAVVAGLGVEGSAKTLEAIVTVRRDLLLLGIAVLIGSVIIGFFFSKGITSPINQIETAAQKIAGGDYDSPIQVGGTGEIGFLGQTMEEMRRAIVQRDVRQKAMLAGVAHEIRNPLGGIELFAGLLASELQDPDQKQEAGKILKETQNLKQIVQDFLDYARPVTPQKENCNISEVFKEAQELLTAELNGCKIECHEETPGHRAWVDPGHLKRIFLNLLKNSSQAMSGSGAIKLRIRSDSRVTKLVFSDSGPGIPEGLRGQIFEPFFTSRKNGTGLGLAIVKSLVEENAGEIELVSQAGAAFEIGLPGASHSK